MNRKNQRVPRTIRESGELSPAVSDWMEDYLNRIGKCLLLTPAQEARLARRAKNGDLSAKQQLVECNLRLVVSVAKAYASSGVSLPDLIQEGNIGLIRAADSFDYRKGFRFSTYAVAWIKQAITRAIERQSRTIRVPGHVIQSLRKLSLLGSTIAADTGHEPTIDELAEHSHLSVERIVQLLRASEGISSLDEVLEDGNTVLGERLEDGEAIDPEEQVLLRESFDLVSFLMEGLNAQERMIIERRFGLVDGVSLTLQDIGQQLNITRERVRQLEARALRKLRIAASRERLEEYFRT